MDPKKRMYASNTNDSESDSWEKMSNQQKDKEQRESKSAVKTDDSESESGEEMRSQLKGQRKSKNAIKAKDGESDSGEKMNSQLKDKDKIKDTAKPFDPPSDSSSDQYVPDKIKDTAKPFDLPSDSSSVEDVPGAALNHSRRDYSYVIINRRRPPLCDRLEICDDSGSLGIKARPFDPASDSSEEEHAPDLEETQPKTGLPHPIQEGGPKGK